MRQTLEQIRARDALNKIRNIQRNYPEDIQQKFVSYVESLPAAILTNGLGQAAATLLAQAKGNERDAHYILYQDLQDWLCRDDPEGWAPYRGETDLMAAIVSYDRTAYLRAQAEALAWLEWLKKFAVAFFKKQEIGSGG
ncbi:type III-B CRISPR module-associated protein Cmr5 [Moorellaceae bacterium AZ2]